MPSDWNDGEIDMSKVQREQWLPVGVRYLSVTAEAVRVDFLDGHSEEYPRPQFVTVGDILQEACPRDTDGDGDCALCAKDRAHCKFREGEEG